MLATSIKKKVIFYNLVQNTPNQVFLNSHNKFDGVSSNFKTNIKQPKIPKSNMITNIQPDVVLLYTRLYKAFFGLVTQPNPLGALNPIFCRTYLFKDVLAAMRLLRFGMRNPNFIKEIFYFDSVT